MFESHLIRDMAVVERPRERLEKLGVDALKDEELLALVLRTGYRGHGAVEVARDILGTHNTRALIRLPFRALASQRGMGQSRAACLLAAVELAQRAHDQPDGHKPRMQTVEDILLQSLDIRALKKEHLLAFFLNARHQLICKETISIGTLTASLAHPREIFAPAIGKAAASIILVHNHPSGDPAPSEEDVRLTQRIRQAGYILGIELIDHLIIAEEGSYSFKSAGRL